MEGINAEFWAFVDANITTDVTKLRLKYHNHKDLGFDIELAITQIECRKKFGKKLAYTLSMHPEWLFPNVLAGEQSTSDRLAQYHATLIAEGETAIDLTAGLGIDALHIAQKASEITAVEIDPNRVEALLYNLGNEGVKIVKADCRDYISEAPEHDVTFIDPARRGEDGSRVYALSQCKPDVVELLPKIFTKAKRLIVKMSPMLDITQTLREMPQTKRIIALGTETECKELVAIAYPDTYTDPDIEAVTIKNDGTISTLSYTIAEEQNAEISDSIGMPSEGDYIYDPYPSVMKAAPYKLLAKRYGVHKIANNTHLYYSAEMAEDFPGQTFRIERVIPYSSKYIKRLKKDYPKASVSTRNFDVPADKLRTKLGVAESSACRLYAVTLNDGSKAMLICTPAKHNI